MGANEILIAEEARKAHSVFNSQRSRVQDELTLDIDIAIEYACVM